MGYLKHYTEYKYDAFEYFEYSVAPDLSHSILQSPYLQRCHSDGFSDMRSCLFSLKLL